MVVDEPHKGLVRRAREDGARATGDVLLYIDADCRAPLQLARADGAAVRAIADASVAVTGPYRFYDWDWIGVAGARLYDYTLAPLDARRGASRAAASARFSTAATSRSGATRWTRSAGSTRSIEFHGEDTNLGRRLAPMARSTLATTAASTRRPGATRRWARARVFRLYVRNFWSEIFHHRPAGRRPRGRQALTCRDTSPISCATSTPTPPGATAG